jgi:NADH-quinone oxidoreductase subunit J
MHEFLFWVTALLTGLCAIAVVVSQNIVRSATWLLFTLGGTAGIFFLLGADFVGATQLLVYVGGTLVLVVFGVMLTAQGPFITMKTSAGEWAISGLVGILLYGVLALSAFTAGKPVLPATVRDYAPQGPLSDNPKTAQYTQALGLGFSGVGVGPAHVQDPPGGPVRMSYLLPFEIVSVHLLVVLIGAAYLARAKRRREAAR